MFNPCHPMIDAHHQLLLQRYIKDSIWGNKGMIILPISQHFFLVRAKKWSHPVRCFHYSLFSWQQESSRIISFFIVLCFLFRTFAPVKLYWIDETEENSNQ